MPSRSLTDSEITSIIGHIALKRDIALFVLGCKTGFRISELLSLTIADVVDKDSVTVRRCNMKGKQVSRTVPLHNEAKAILKEYIHETVEARYHSSVVSSLDLPRVSTSTYGSLKLFPMSRMHAWRILKQAAYELGIKGKISTHSMRKTFAQGVYSRTNKDIVATQKALGHKSLASTTHYLDVNRDTVDAAILSG